MKQASNGVFEFDEVGFWQDAKFSFKAGERNRLYLLQVKNACVEKPN